MCDVIVVGAGLFGAAAARYVARAGASVTVLGPVEPNETASHDGVFSSHYDDSRIVRRTTRDLLWAELAHRSLGAFAALEQETGIRFLYPKPGLHLVAPGQGSVFIDTADDIAKAFDVPYQRLSGAREIMAVAPDLHLTDDVHGMIEYAPAGYLNPRDLIRAQLMQATGHGATVIRDIATAITSKDGTVEVATQRGRRYRAKQAIVAAGAYSKSPGLLPRPLSLLVKSETVLRALVSEADAERLSHMPTVVYEFRGPRVDTLYMVPPVLGSREIKLGCNTALDRYLSTPDEMNQWMRAGASDAATDDMVAALRILMPEVQIEAATTKRCLITYTPEGWPMVDYVDDGIMVATGGNGLGAKSSDAIGAVAAEMAMGRRLLAKDDMAKMAVHLAAPNRDGGDAGDGPLETFARRPESDVIVQRPFGQVP